ncbi:MAG: integrase, partial [Ignavibacteriae bacterium]|nr:integrase [Ignavibacteriota bacterium]
MATAKIVLRKKKNTDGTFPLALRITKDRKSSYVYLGYRVREKDWDATAQRVRKSHPNAQRLNTFLMQTLADAGNVMLDFDVQRKQS